MAEYSTQRYYWIKITDRFMTSDTVDFLMEQKDGANYVVRYRMLCLKTVNNDGRLSRTIGEVIIPYDEAKIQRDTKWFTIDTIRVALELYKKLGLIYEQEDGIFRITDFDKMIGSQTPVAERVARYRERQKALQCNENVTENVTASNGECNENCNVDKEKDKNKEKDMRDRVCLFDNYNILQNNISESEQKQASKQANEPIGFYGVHKNIGLTDKQYKELDEKYSYAKQVINSLSEYKYRKGITGTVKDYDVLLEWLEKDKGRYEGQPGSFGTDDFFEAALKRSYRREI